MEQRRQVARKVRIKDIIGGSFVRSEGEFEPSFIRTADGTSFSRVNVIAAVCQEPADGSSMIDDGTGQIGLRSFDGPLQGFSLGDVVLVIGRVREYGNLRYLMPEIVKRVQKPGWIEYRKKELLEEPTLQPLTLFDKAISAIKRLDKGDGADTESVLTEMGSVGSEGMIDSLLKEGEIFELSPGRLKVIE